MRGPSFQLALNIKNLNFEDITPVYHSSASDIIFLYQLDQARPHNVLHFLVYKYYSCMSVLDNIQV